ncbi:MAG: AsmA family protein [Syntrophales bacterium]|jgi:AsmA protein|nr:AsmA family protein [Syntrophales bacterium]MDY0043036.1 AsmA family protein [Syntrophales bacterium]
MKAVKWILICAIGLIVIVIGALLIIPMFVDAQKYKPYVEKQVSRATGLPFSINGELELSLFPWAGIEFSDLHLGNPPGFTEKDLLAVKSFDVKVKLIPLLSRDVQVDRFLVDGMKVVLEKNKEGKVNLEALAASSKAPQEQKEPEKGSAGGLPVKNIAVAEMTVSNGTLLWIDAAAGTRKEITDLNLELDDVSFDRPVHIMVSANLDRKPLALDGTVGPLGREPGREDIPLDIAVKAFEELSLTVKGMVKEALEQPSFDLALEIAPFSPRKLVNAVGEAFPVVTADPDALTRVSLKAKVKGTPSAVSVNDGIMNLDQSTITFSAQAKDFAKPDVMLRMNIDEIDVDRYLPQPAEKEAPAGAPAEDTTASPAPAAGEKPAVEKPTPASAPTAPQEKKTDYGPLRTLVLDAEMRAGKVKVMDARVQDILVKVSGKNGIFRVDPFDLKAYQGTIAGQADLDVRGERPKTAVNLEASGIMVQPLLKDVMKKDFLEGATQAKMSLNMEGDDPDAIKRTLDGKGDLRFTDGAIVGIDLPGMVRNMKAAFGAEKPAERPKTDFSEFLVQFTIDNGLVNVTQMNLAAPALRVAAAGDIDLVKETLDLRVEPKIVGTLKGQQDVKERAGLMVPVLVTGTFSSPKFAPDLKGVVESQIKKRLKAPGDLKDILKGKGEAGDTDSAPVQEKAKEALKGIFGK